MRILFLLILYWMGVSAPIPLLAIPRDASSSLLIKADSVFLANNYIDAMDLYLKTVAILETEKTDSPNLPYAYHKLAICYDYFDLPDHALLYFRKAKVLYEKRHDQIGLADCLARIGDAYEDAGNNELAMKEFDKALLILKKTQNSKGLAMVLENIGSVYENYKDYTLAEKYFTESLTLYGRIHDSTGIAVVLNNIGDSYFKRSDYKKALSFYKQSMDIAISINNQEEIRGNLKDLSKTYHALNDHKNAYLAFYDFFEMHKKLKIERKIEEISNLQTSFIEERKANEIKMLETEKQNAFLRQILLLAGIGLMGGIMVLAFINYKTKITKNRELSEVRENMLKVELRNSILEKQKLEQNLELGRQELILYAKTLMEKGKMIEELKTKISSGLSESNVHQEMLAVEELISTTLLTEEAWQKFKTKFELVYRDFFLNLKEKHPDFTAGEIRMAAMIRLDLKREEIARILGISPESVKKARSRLKKKIAISSNVEESSIKLKEWIANI